MVEQKKKRDEWKTKYQASRLYPSSTTLHGWWEVNMKTRLEEVAKVA